jgi:hypothetical protein
MRLYFLSCCLGLITLCSFIIGTWVALADLFIYLFKNFFFKHKVALCN